MKFAFFAALSGVAFASFAATVDVTTVEELRQAVVDAQDGDEILIHASGSPYDLGKVESIHAVAHLYTTKAVNFRGETGNPGDVVLLGSGNRILYLSSPDFLRISALTFKNGDCTKNKASTTAPEDGQDGGAICLRGDKSNAVIENCLFVGNKAYSAGGACGNYYAINSSKYAGTYRECVFSNNVSSSSGGAVRSPKEIVNCTFVGNTGHTAGALCQPRRVSGCTFVSNTGTLYGGAIYWVTEGSHPDSFITNCTFRLNTAKAGGAIYGGAGCAKIVDCLFEGNVATERGPSNSGGALKYATNGVFNCTFRTNESIYGNVYYSDISDSTFYLGPKAITNNGEIASYSKLTRCKCVMEGSPAGGSLTYYTTARECLFTGTISRSVHGTFLWSDFDGCRFENLVAEPGTISGPYLFGRTTSLTNCLVVGCNVLSYCYNTVQPGGFFNCSFISNSVSTWTAGGSNNRDAAFVNTLFYGNKLNGNDYDIDSTAAKVILGFTNCIFTVTSANEKYAPGENNINLYGKTFDPRFMGAADPKNPFAPRLTSPLVENPGVVQDWMKGATDLRGEGYPRLRDGVVHIGCYQCWLTPDGFRFLYR